MVLLGIIWALLFIHSCFAVLEIETPESGDKFTASSGKVTIPVTWGDDSADPPLSYISSYTFKLCTGANSNIIAVDVTDPISASEISDQSYKPVFDASKYSSGLFYVQIYAELQSGDGYIIEYTPRVTITGLTGSVAPSGSGAVLAVQVNYDNSAEISKSFTVPYTEQTGTKRYAPMQMQPGTTITATTWSRRFPTSAVTYYSTLAGTPVCQSTVTPGWSYTMSSEVNMATPAPFPSEVSWYPASAKVSAATLNEKRLHQRKKRWL